MLVLIQRREADRGRNIDDKIDLLFNAKRLRVGETAYLKDQVKRISADCRVNWTEIDIVAHDRLNNLLQLDVSRRFHVANYLANETAVYEFKLKIKPDDACGNSPCVAVFPSMTTILLPDGRGGFESAADEIIDPGAEIEAGQQYETAPLHLEIEAGQMREFRTRYRVWQRLFRSIPASPPDAQPILESDAYELLIKKHWDEIRIHLRNSLATKIAITISGRESRSFELQPGDQQHKAYRVENLGANSRICVSFAVL